MLVTSDLHGQLVPLSTNGPDQEPSGLSVISSILSKFRTEHTITLDLGDTIQGSPMMAFHQQNRKKYPMPAAVLFNHLGIDFFVPGNHDFNYGRHYLDDFINRLTVTEPLCGNIVDFQNRPAFGKPYAIIADDNGPRIAVIGMTTHYIPNWERQSHITHLRFLDAFETTKKWVEYVKRIEDPQLIVVAYHGGFEKDLETFEPYIADTGENQGSRMLEEIPGIDILITGHQHRSLVKTIRGTLVIQPEFNGRAVAVIDVLFTKKDVWTVEEKSAVLEKARNYQSDPVCENLIEPLRSDTEVYLDTPIGKTRSDDLRINDLFLARQDKHKIVTFINQVQLKKTKAQLSCCSLGNQATGFPRTIRIRDVLSTYVFPNSLVVLKIDGKNLLAALEKNAEYFALDESGQIVANPKYSYPKVEHYNYDMFDGIDYVIDVARPVGHRIVSCNYQGKPVEEGQYFSLAMNNYRATGGGEFWMYRHLDVIKEVNQDIADLIMAHIRRHQTIDVDDVKNIRVINSNRD
jgi:2',3'-cyclic-nucleotide 2'-phosphodiesterase/3'-nucleotidase